MSRILGPEDQHPFTGLDIAWLLETRAETRRDHLFLVWEPFSEVQVGFANAAGATSIKTATT